jgi:hypothetical protein
VPNLITDRGFWLAFDAVALNVRRLIHQSLIWPGVVGDDASRLSSAFDAEDGKGLADALVDRVGRDAKLGGDFLGAEVAVDQAQAVELPGAEAGDPLRHRRIGSMRRLPLSHVRQIVGIVQGCPHPAQHYALPSHESERTLRSFAQISPDFQRISAKMQNVALTFVNILSLIRLTKRPKWRISARMRKG